MNINQMSLSYVIEQDRMLLRINTKANEEMRMWFTRRLAMKLFPAISNLASEQTVQLAMANSPIASTDAHSKKMLADFKKEETLQKANFSTPFQEKANSFPFGEKPLLVTDVRIVPMPNGSLEISVQGINEADNIGQGIKMVLDISLLHALMHLMEKALAKSEWAALPGVAAAPALEGPDASALPGDKPKYLN